MHARIRFLLIAAFGGISLFKKKVLIEWRKQASLVIGNRRRAVECSEND